MAFDGCRNADICGISRGVMTRSDTGPGFHQIQEIEAALFGAKLSIIVCAHLPITRKMRGH